MRGVSTPPDKVARFALEELLAHDLLGNVNPLAAWLLDVCLALWQHVFALLIGCRAIRLAVGVTDLTDLRGVKALAIEERGMQLERELGSVGVRRSMDPQRPLAIVGEPELGPDDDDLRPFRVPHSELLALALHERGFELVGEVLKELVHGWL